MFNMKGKVQKERYLNSKTNGMLYCWKVLTKTDDILTINADVLHILKTQMPSTNGNSWVSVTHNIQATIVWVVFKLVTVISTKRTLNKEEEKQSNNN